MYSGKKVLITGHTGFRGTWLTLWLAHLGATTYGYALPPPTDPSMFRLLRMHEAIDHQIGDIRDGAQLRKAIAAIKPDIIFHLAGHTMVKGSIESPVYAVEVNTLGTVNVMEAVRHLNLPVAMVMATSDKCYEDRKWLHSYRETDRLAGHDPFAASKSAAEIMIGAWRNAFFPPERVSSHGVRLSSVRAPTIMGGGDWTRDHLVPTYVRALEENKPLEVHHPRTARSWQHVLELLAGYLMLGAKLLKVDPGDASNYCDAFNFGTLPHLKRTDLELAEKVLSYWGKGSWRVVSSPDVSESSVNLSIDKAYHLLGWYPKLDFDETVRRTVEWYRYLYRDETHIRQFTLKQIRHYADDDAHDLKKTIRNFMGG